MALIQAILDLARGDLNDALVVGTSTVTPRTSEADLLTFANNGIAIAYGLRPDLAFTTNTGTNAWTEYVDLTSSSTFPLPRQYQEAVASYIVSMVNSGDDAFVNSGKADKELADYIRGLGL